MLHGFSVLEFLFPVALFAILLYSLAGIGRRRGRGPEDTWDRRGWCGPCGPCDEDEEPHAPPDASARGSAPAAHWECLGQDCRASNPAHARFCRMCGRARP